jgi:hypothetical protein
VRRLRANVHASAGAAEDAEYLGGTIAGAAEPVRQHGVELGRFTHPEDEVPLAQDEPQPPREDVELLIPGQLGQRDAALLPDAPQPRSDPFQGRGDAGLVRWRPGPACGHRSIAPTIPETATGVVEKLLRPANLPGMNEPTMSHAMTDLHTADRSRPLRPPTKHQLALMIWIAVFPTLTVLNLHLGDLLTAMPSVARTFVLATIAVPIVIYGLMPLLHRLRARIHTRHPA